MKLEEILDKEMAPSQSLVRLWHRKYLTMRPKGMLRRLGRPKDAGLRVRRRNEIVIHAIKEFARSGYVDADIDAIAANSGCSKGTLYNHFSGKSDLFSASVEKVMLSIVEATEVSGEGDPLDLLVQLVRGFLRHFADHPQHAELLIQERSNFPHRERPTYFQRRAASRRQWQTRFERLMKQGRMRRMPAEQATEIVDDLLYGTVFLNYFRRQLKPEQLDTELLSVLFGELCTETELLISERPNSV